MVTATTIMHQVNNHQCTASMVTTRVISGIRNNTTMTTKQIKSALPSSTITINNKQPFSINCHQSIIIINVRASVNASSSSSRRHIIANKQCRTSVSVIIINHQQNVSTNVISSSGIIIIKAVIIIIIIINMYQKSIQQTVNVSQQVSPQQHHHQYTNRIIS
jgi:gamma-glutamyltranspeptidase